MTFSEIIHPISIAEFFSEYYEKKELHIKRKDKNYYHPFISPDEIDGYVQLKQTYSPNVKLAFQGEEISPLVFSKELTSIGSYRVEKNKLLNYFDKGYTIKFDKLHQTYPPIAKKISNLEQEIGIGIRTSLYISPKNTQGYGVHTDRHDVLALQVNGTKFWKVKKSEENLPSVYKTPIDVKWEDGLDEKIYSIESGDFFYCPRGLAHDVYTQDKSSTHFTLGFKPVYKYELLDELSKVAYLDDHYRKAIPNNYSSALDKESFAKSLKGDLHLLVENLDIKTLLDLSLQKMKSSQLNFKQNDFSNRFFEPNDQDVYAVCNSEDWQIVEQSICIELKNNGLSYNFPLQAKNDLQKLMAGQKMSVNDLGFGVQKNQSLKLLKRLVSLQFLKCSSNS